VFGLPLTRTVDGFEAHMGTNYLGHFALTCLLGDKIADGVASVVSAMYAPSHIHLDDLNWHTRTYSKWTAYGESKLAIMLFTHELTRRGMRAYATDPGATDTDIIRNGSRVMLWLAERKFAVLRAQPGAGSASHHSGGDDGPAQRHLSCAAVQPTGQAEGDSDERQGA
jgi:NAD(P)-dependent dehydrogenase (short-subunit alcohol dehydrogenase family)